MYNTHPLTTGEVSISWTTVVVWVFQRRVHRCPTAKRDRNNGVSMGVFVSSDFFVSQKIEGFLKENHEVRRGASPRCFSFVHINALRRNLYFIYFVGGARPELMRQFLPGKMKIRSRGAAKPGPCYIPCSEVSSRFHRHFVPDSTGNCVTGTIFAVRQRSGSGVIL